MQQLHSSLGSHNVCWFHWQSATQFEVQFDPPISLWWLIFTVEESLHCHSLCNLSHCVCVCCAAWGSDLLPPDWASGALKPTQLCFYWFVSQWNVDKSDVDAEGNDGNLNAMCYPLVTVTAHLVISSLLVCVCVCACRLQWPLCMHIWFILTGYQKVDPQCKMTHLAFRAFSYEAKMYRFALDGPIGQKYYHSASSLYMYMCITPDVWKETLRLKFYNVFIIKTLKFPP